MINNIPSDKELFDLENRIRVLLAELVTPVILKTKEHDSLIKKALSSNRKNKKTIQTLEIELKNSISKLAPLDELNKRISVLLSDQKTSAKAIGLEIGLLNAKLDETLYKYSDFDSKFRIYENNQEKITKNVEDNYRYIREFQDILRLENDRILALLKDFKNKQEALNENFEIRIGK